MGTNSSPEYPWPGGTPGAEAPDPVAGKPGHFAWSRWIKQYVKNLNTNLMAHQDHPNPHPQYGMGNVITDHGALSGLTDDDHPQYQNVAQKGVASGYATLDSGIKVPIAQIPTGTTPTTVALGDHSHTLDSLSDVNTAGVAVGQSLVYGASGWVPGAGSGGSGGVTDHGMLTGLANDDHLQYFNTVRGDARYATISHVHAIADLPATLATDAEVTTAISAHDALTNAHPNLRGTATPAIADASVAAVGLSSKFAREDHRHSAKTEVPVALGPAIALGSSTSLSRADHVHPFPSLDNLSDVATAGAANGQALVYGSGTWAPGTVSGGGGVDKGAGRSVLDYGAVGDGVTNCDTAFANALAANALVLVPAGTYKITVPIVMISGKAIIGDIGAKDSPDATPVAKIVQHTNTAEIIKGVDIRGVTLENLFLTVNSQANHSADGIAFTRSTHGATNYVTITNVHVASVGRDGFSMSNLIVSTWTGAVAVNSGRHGFNIYGTVPGAAGTSLVMNGCYANTCGFKYPGVGSGYYIRKMTYSSLNGCASDGCSGPQYNISQCQGVALNGCGSEVGSAGAFKFSETCIGVVATGCWAYATVSGVDFDVSGSESVVLNGCTQMDANPVVIPFRTDDASIVTIINPFYYNTVPNVFGTQTTVINDVNGNSPTKATTFAGPTALKAGVNVTGAITGTSPLAINGATHALLNLNRKAAANLAQIEFQTNGAQKWALGTYGGTENMRLWNSVAGAAAVTMDSAANRLTVAGDPSALLGVATKQYVDTKVAAGGGAAGGGWAVTDPVKDFGAVGNGVADDTIPLQNAINADKPIALGGRTYKITAALTLKSGTRIFGDRAAPWGTPAYSPPSMIVQTSTTQPAFTGVDVYDIVMENVRLEGPGSGTGDGIILTRSTKAAVNYISLKNVYIRTFGRDGLSISNCIVSSFDRVICESNGRHGFNFYGVYKGSAGTSVAMNACYANNNLGSGFYINTMTYMGFNACASEGHPIDYDIVSCQGMSFTGCGSEDNHGISWKISDESYGIGLYSCWNYTSKNISVLVTGNSHATIISGFVECDADEALATYSTQVDAGCQGTVILGGSYVKPRNLAPLTTTVIDDGGGGIHANDTFISGSMWLDDVWDARFFKAETGVIRTDAIFRIGGSGSLQLGVAGDVNLYRIGANAMGTDGTIASYGPATDPYHVATKSMVDLKLDKAGGVMTGNVTIDSAGHSIMSVDRGTTASFAQFEFLTMGVQDFAIAVRGTGASKGLFVYDTQLAKDVVAIDSATGRVVLADDPLSPMGVATKQYVDNRTPKILPGTTAPTDLTAIWIDTN